MMRSRRALLLLLVLCACAHVGLSASCPSGKFGTSCSFDCNCRRLAECIQTTESKGCTGGCGDGYTGKPGCQTTCDGFHFGADCGTACHCRPSVRCDRYSGQCSDGKCDPHYYSSNCQLRRPQLMTPPNVTVNDCTGLTLTWLQFRWGVDPGSANATEYKVYAHYESQDLLLGTVVNKANSATNQFSIVDTLNVSQTYLFSITPVFEFLTVSDDGVASNQTAAVLRTCDKTPPSPGAPTIKMAGDFGLNVSWSTTQHVDKLKTVRVSWTKLRYGECPLASGTAQSVDTPLATGFVFLNLSTPWTEYKVAMVALDAASVSSAAVEWQQYTDEEAPTVTVGSVTAVAAETTATIQWSKPPCQGQGGKITQYLVQLLQLYDNKKISLPGGGLQPATVLALNAVGLSSSTWYTASVQFRTSKGVSKDAAFNFTTNGTAPSAPTELKVTTIGDSWARLEWKKPRVAPSGTTYRVTVSPRTPATIVTADLFVNVTGLRPSIKYSATVQAKFSGALHVPSNTVTFVFRAAVEGSPTVPGLVGSVGEPYEANVSWTPPSGGVAPTLYMIKATPVNGTLNPSSVAAVPVTTNASSGASKGSVGRLRPATQYRITVTPVYPVNVLGQESSPVEMWTGPGPMTSPPPQPQVVSTAETSFKLLLKPVDYKEGPLEYYIAVATATARRKRAASTSDLGLPAGAKIVGVVAAPKAGGTEYTVGSRSAGTKYRVHWVATSAVGPRRVTRSSSLDVTTASGSSLAWIAAVVVLLLLLIILIIVLVLLWRRRQGQLQGKQDQSLQLNLQVGDKVPGRLIVPQYFKNWSDTERLNDARFVVLDPEYGPRDLKVDSLRNRQEPHDYESFEKEYRSLPCGLEKSCNAGRLPENQPKNRNPSILPYDHSRVTLERNGSDSYATDYINASYVDGYLRKRAYIAAQSPFDDDTVADFWLMIYQANVQQVVMMTEMLEEATVKCTQYWPECGSAEQFGDVHVTCVEEEEFAFHTVRQLQLRLRGRAYSATQPLKQYQFHGWPEHGVPSSPIPLLDMYTRVKMDMRQHMGPLVVHCGTGISRTAVFIALDSLLQQAIHENVVNVYKFCARLRKTRPNMVRTARQYMFLYDLIFESLLASNQIANLDVRETFRQLSGKNPSTGHSFLWEQHCLLEKYTPRAGPCEAGRHNPTRNRFPSVLPPDEHRVRLSGPDYINAVFVDGVFAQDELILTQTPLASTRGDLWRMVVEQRVTFVVDVEPEHRGREGAVDWYPGPGLSLQVEPGVVVRSGPVSEPANLPGICVREVSVSGSRNPVRVFALQRGVWPDPYAKVPSDRAALLSLVQAVRAEEGRSGPVAVVCVDGATRSGLFAACFLAAQKLSCDHYVDVFRTVKAVKLRRYQVVPHLDQYKLVFKLLWDFVRRFMEKELHTEMASHGLSGHLPEGDLESVYSHTQCPILHIEQQGTLSSSGVHYRYASAELV